MVANNLIGRFEPSQKKERPEKKCALRCAVDRFVLVRSQGAAYFEAA